MIFIKTVSRMALALALVSISLTSASATKSPVLRLLVPGVFISEELAIASQPRTDYRTSFPISDCLPINHPLLATGGRNLLELMIVCDVIKQAQLADQIALLPYPNPRRAIASLIQGNADAFGTSLFRSRMADYHTEVHISAPLIAKGDFHVGLFTSPERADVLAVEDLKGLRALTGITVEHWMIDRITMESLNLRDLVTVGKPQSMPPMIAGRRADFTFLSLNSQQIDRLGGMLVRIDGMKVSLQDDRILAVSKKRTDVFDALQAYLKTNNASDNRSIYNAYVKAGIISDKYSDWIDISPK